MHCELVAPGLLAASGASAAPSLELLAARGRRSRAEPQPLEAWLRDAFALGERLSAGALSLLGAGGAPGDSSWTRADPVHLQVMRDRVLLAPASVPREEADALCEALNRHFAGALAFRALDAQRWCARLERDLDLGDETPLDMAGREAAGRPGDALLTEIQMLLHAHPVNEAREARGEPPVNSVWFWGPGRLPDEATSRWHSVTSVDPLALGMARLAGAAARSLPASGTAWLAGAPEAGRHLIVLEGPADVQALEADWFAPLAAALRGGRVGMVTLQVPDAGFSVQTIRGDYRRFWRRPKALQNYA